MTTTDTELSRRAEVFGCGRGLDLLERLAATPDGIGTDKVSLILGLKSSKGSAPGCAPPGLKSSPRASS